MKSEPLLLGILLGIIVILIIGGVSLSVRLNQLRKNYQEVAGKNLKLEELVENLKAEKEALIKANQDLKNKIEELKKEIDKLTNEKESLKLELEKMRRLKEKLEESLKEELMKEE